MVLTSVAFPYLSSANCAIIPGKFLTCYGIYVDQRTHVDYYANRIVPFFLTISQVAMAKPPTQSRDPIETTKRLPSSALGASRLGMGGLGMGLMRGRDRHMPSRMMGYGADFGFSEVEQGYGAYGTAAANGYNVPGLALVPMYLPNGQVRPSFVGCWRPLLA